MNEIHWPDGLRPGFVDNFVSNEIVVRDLSAAAVFDTLVDTRTWAEQYDNATDIRFHDGPPPYLAPGLRFAFTTFELPVEAEITEFVRPEGDTPGRIAWHGWLGGDPDEPLDVHHAWLFEALPDNRLRLAHPGNPERRPGPRDGRNPAQSHAQQTPGMDRRVGARGRETRGLLK